MKFAKYHGLGNVYIVLETETSATPPSQAMIKTICDTHYGVGSDGILWGPLPSGTCDFGLLIYNPDGSDAEKSGNGLRIFARYLFDTGRVSYQLFTLETLGGNVGCSVAEDNKKVEVALGQVSFASSQVPVAGAEREVLNESMTINGRSFKFSAVTLGNPHCVVLLDAPPTPELAQTFGPHIEHSPLFPKRTNVQFMYVQDRANIQIEIWERGANYTLASGSSSVAATAVARRLGLCDNSVTVHMPGGTLAVALDSNWNSTLIGPVTKICDGEIAPEMFQER
ncbi:diaminopimelate epimerase [Candidatus Leptofilum sp.]|uniref:diaminopimelate epimerase n=1 Tax=Candidatus Leptofilum sp. TaxID=3241576 RepID=UPI003B591347